MAPLLQIRGLTRRFGGVAAVDALDLEVAEGELVSLIGPNGAGKTTTFNLISGLDRADAGEVLFDGRRIERLLAGGDRRARRRAHVPARPRLRQSQRARQRARSARTRG